MGRKRTLAIRLLRRESGASAAEFVLVLPLLALLLTGTIDIGGMAWTKLQVAAAARAGASYALTKGFDAGEISSAVTGATNLAVTPTTPVQSFGCADASTGITTVPNNTTPCPSGALPGTYVTVAASADYNLLFDWTRLSDSLGLSNPVVLSSATTVRIP